MMVMVMAMLTVVVTRVAKNSYPLYLNCIQTKMSALNLPRKCTQFSCRWVLFHFWVLFITFCYNPSFIANYTQANCKQVFSQYHCLHPKWFYCLQLLNKRKKLCRHNAAKLYVSNGCRNNICKYWMQQYCIHPKFFRFLQLLY